MKAKTTTKVYAMEHKDFKAKLGLGEEERVVNVTVTDSEVEITTAEGELLKQGAGVGYTRPK